MKKVVTIAHSPDADDIFMYMAIHFGWIGNDFIYKNTALDIQSLNEFALKNEFDATAISFGLYPLIAKEYALLRTAVSFGQGYGPKLIKKKDTQLKRNFKVALSGANTTNALIFRMKYPEARIIYKNFLDIENTVLSGEVDAGVLIHESILDFDQNLCVEAEIWDIWMELVKDDLPLPLGGMALRRSLPLSDAIKIEKDLTNAVKIADSNRQVIAPMLLERNLIRVDEKKLDTYLNLYANKNSISMNEKQLYAVDTLFKLGYDYKFYDKIINVNDYLIPSEYEQARNS
ncbi:menaquinone biosynthesis family protein [Campylobacter estrildidarum]|uniref:1,4-dihydroxy-6-naphtoate synthase n=1 Tax=Campylobacter estrildidarum TaxID=2510189 RepID=A0A4U7BQE8_9BACT|nr:menaquinone biosynthesis family protein [Campylobacter estrildidarum]TKX31156.1 S-ribosylhomocysteine lyase [Campylobacter estrildidarum]